MLNCVSWRTQGLVSDSGSHPWQPVSLCRRVGNYEGEANTAIMASAAETLSAIVSTSAMALIAQAPDGI
jgi:hypothetical protein